MAMLLTTLAQMLDLLPEQLEADANLPFDIARSRAGRGLHPRHTWALAQDGPCVVDVGMYIIGPCAERFCGPPADAAGNKE